MANLSVTVSFGRIEIFDTIVIDSSTNDICYTSDKLSNSFVLARFLFNVARRLFLGRKVMCGIIFTILDTFGMFRQNFVLIIKI